MPPKPTQTRASGFSARLVRLIAIARPHPYLTSYLIGLVYFSFVISWMFGLRTAEIASGPALTVVVITAGLTMLSAFALGFLMFTWLMRRSKLSLRDQGWWLIPALWVVAEYLRSVLFSVVSLGPGGRIGPFWSFGSIGYWLVDTPLVYAARWGGLYLLSAIGVALIVALGMGVIYKRWRPLIIVTALTLIFSISGYALYTHPTGPGRDVVAIQFDSEFNPSQFSDVVADLSRRQAAGSADVVFLPEYSHLWEEKTEQDTQAMRHLLKSADGLVIDSTQEPSAGSAGHNLVSYHRADGSLLNTQAKWFAIPGGEYVPYVYQVILAYVGQEQLLLHFNDQKSITSGSVPEEPYEFGGVRYGAMACSASIVPELYRGMTQRGATILSNAASLDTLGVADSYHGQTRTMARLHAVANARPFVQAARGGYSYIIDTNGRFIDQTDQKEYRLLSGRVTTNNHKTPYTVLGDWPVLVSALSALLWWLKRRSTSRV